MRRSQIRLAALFRIAVFYRAQIILRANHKRGVEFMEAVCPILGRMTRVEPTPFSRDVWNIVRCCESGFVFLANPPDYSQLTSEFAWEVTSQAESERRKAAEPVLSRISHWGKRAKVTLFPRRNRFFTLADWVLRDRPEDQSLRFLDIGCAGGELLVDLHARFAEQGRRITPIGIEVSPPLAEAAAVNFEPMGGLVVRNNAIDGSAGMAAGSIDIAIMSSFLEHECQPLTLLKQLHPLIADDGAIVLKVPNFGCWNRSFRAGRWCGFRYPDHVNYFTPATLRRLAAESGWQVARQRTLDCLPFSDTMYAVLRKCG